MNSYLADTTVLIDHLRGNENAAAFLKKNRPYISIATIVELIQGSKTKREQAAAIKTCTDLSELPIDRKISMNSLGLMKEFCLSNGLQFVDSIIAATALSHQLVLVTNNIKHFRFISGLEVISHQQVFKN